MARYRNYKNSNLPLFGFNFLILNLGYEIIGIDKIPEGPALLIFYHPMAPLGRIQNPAFF